MPLQADGDMLCNNPCLFYHLYTIINTSIGPTCSLQHQVVNGVVLTLLVSGSLIIMQCNQPLDFSILKGGSFASNVRRGDTNN